MLEHAHVPCENDEIDFGVAQLAHQLLFTLGRESRLKAAFLDGSRLKAGGARQFQNTRVEDIASRRQRGDSAVHRGSLRGWHGSSSPFPNRERQDEADSLESGNHLPARVTSQAVLPNIYFPCKMRLAGEQ